MRLKNVLYGFLSWLIPFASSFFFYTREGKLTIDALFFKSIMIVVGSVSAAFLLVSYAIPAMSIAVGAALENKR